MSKILSGLGLFLIIIGICMVGAKYIFGMFANYPWALLALLPGFFLRWLGRQEEARADKAT